MENHGEATEDILYLEFHVWDYTDGPPMMLTATQVNGFSELSVTKIKGGRILFAELPQ